MNINILTQPKLSDGKDYCLGKHLKSLFLSKRPKYNEISLLFGLIKNDAFIELLGDIKSYILNGGNIKFYLNQTQKGNIKKTINSLLELGCQVYLFKNENKDFIEDFQYKSIILESTKKSIVLLPSGNFTLNGLFDGYNTITELTYDLSKESKEFEEIKNNIFNDNLCNKFIEINRENFKDFFSDEIPSIEEFTHKDLEQQEPIITAVDDIDIEIDDNVDFLETPTEVEKEKKIEKIDKVEEKETISKPIEEIKFESTKYFTNEDALDIENMLFTSSKQSNKEDVIEEKTLEQGKIIAKTTNLSKTSIFMLQIPKIAKKGTYAGEIKIPSYLRDLIPSFWGWPKEYSIEKDSIEKSKICKFQIIDTLTPNHNIIDENVKLFQREGENSFIIHSEKLMNLDLNENDIIRFIKTQSKDGYYYTCEIIRTNADEYPIWEQFCTTQLKGSKRKYGTM